MYEIEHGNEPDIDRVCEAARKIIFPKDFRYELLKGYLNDVADKLKREIEEDG